MNYSGIKKAANSRDEAVLRLNIADNRRAASEKPGEVIPDWYFKKNDKKAAWVQVFCLIFECFSKSLLLFLETGL